MEPLELVPTRIRIVSIIRKAILTGEYKSGQELSLTGVAEQLGCSRTPVREAFQALESEGLIRLRMNKGAVVNYIDDKFIRDHFEIRSLLESEAAAKAARNGMDTHQLLEELIKIQPRMGEISTSEYEELNVRIHRSIWRAANNRKMERCLHELWNGPSTGLNGFDTVDHYIKSTEEHIILLSAIQDRDENKARKIMEKHISRSMANMERILERIHDGEPG